MPSGQGGGPRPLTSTAIQLIFNADREIRTFHLSAKGILKQNVPIVDNVFEKNGEAVVELNRDTIEFDTLVGVRSQIEDFLFEDLMITDVYVLAAPPVGPLDIGRPLAKSELGLIFEYRSLPSIPDNIIKDIEADIRNMTNSSVDFRIDNGPESKQGSIIVNLRSDTMPYTLIEIIVDTVPELTQNKLENLTEVLMGEDGEIISYGRTFVVANGQL